MLSCSHSQSFNYGKEPKRILLLGEASVGKSTLIRALKDQYLENSNYSPTETCSEVKFCNSGENLLFIDTPGLEQAYFNKSMMECDYSIKDAYYHLIMFVLKEENRFEKLRAVYNKYVQTLDLQANKENILVAIAMNGCYGCNIDRQLRDAIKKYLKVELNLYSVFYYPGSCNKYDCFYHFSGSFLRDTIAILKKIKSHKLGVWYSIEKAVDEEKLLQKNINSKLRSRILMKGSTLETRNAKSDSSNKVIDGINVMLKTYKNRIYDNLRKDLNKILSFIKEKEPNYNPQYILACIEESPFIMFNADYVIKVDNYFLFSSEGDSYKLSKLKDWEPGDTHPFPQNLPIMEFYGRVTKDTNLYLLDEEEPRFENVQTNTINITGKWS